MRMKSKANQQGKVWLKREMRPYRAFVAFLTCLTIFGTLFSLAFAYLIRYLINSATDENKSMLLLFSAVLLAILFLKIVLQTLNSYFSEKSRAKIVADLRTKTFAKLLRADYGAFQKYHSGDLLTRITSDISEIASDYVGLLPALVGLAVQCVGAIAALLTLDPLFTGIYVVCGVLGGCISAFFRKHLKRYHKDFMQADGESRSFIQEGLTSALTFKAYGAEGKIAEKAARLSDVYYGKRMKRNLLRTCMSAVFSLLSNVGLIFAVVWCSVGLLTGRITEFGSVLSIVLLLNQLQHPFSAVSSIVPVYYAQIASAERMEEIDALPMEETKSQTVSYADLHALQLKNVSFNYGRERVIENATATLEKGSIVCVTGQSGSGKSTLFKLLLRVYEPTEGEMLALVGKENVPLSCDTRNLFAYVPQGNFLFSGTIYDNVVFFAENPTDEDVENALKAACAEFVYDLPDGLQTPLLERGGGLSEGQMQRLAIARALLSNRPVLLFDEATSALDGETEKRLLQNVKAMQNKTCILVTHRPAALAIADRILDVQDGKVHIVK